jgi:hypothetical protein
LNHHWPVKKQISPDKTVIIVKICGGITHISHHQSIISGKFNMLFSGIAKGFFVIQRTMGINFGNRYLQGYDAAPGAFKVIRILA